MLKQIKSLFLDVKLVLKKAYRKGETLFLEGDECVNVGYIVSGSLIFKNIYDNGHESVVKYAAQDDLFGEVLLFCSSNSYPATIIAASDSQVNYLSKDQLIALMASSPFLAIEFLEIIANKAYELNTHIKLLNNHSLCNKIAFYLYQQKLVNNQNTFTVPMNREELAAYLNVERPSLSRELSNMRKKGIIDYDGQEFVIKDLYQLQQLI